MKIAVIADIHGNIVALDAVLAEIESEKPDRVVCLGDVAAKGPAPAQVIERLMSLDWTFIMGNTDEWMVRRLKQKPANERERLLIASAHWGFAQLNDKQRAFVAGFRPNAALDLGGSQLLCYHGSPDSNETSILPETTSIDLDRLLKPWPARVYAGAHTHVRMLRPHRSALVFNPGSVGMASATRPNGEDHLVPRAEFAFVETTKQGMRIDFRELELDRSALIASVKQCDSPDADWWIEGWSS